MEYSRESDRTYTVGLLSGLAIGALAMYLLDPVQGRRRRALVTDETYRAMVTTRKAINAKARDLGNRTEGLAAKARGAVTGTSESASWQAMALTDNSDEVRTSLHSLEQSNYV